MRIVNTQQISSILRQLLGIVATVFGVLTASTSSLHLPVAISSILTAAGPIILTVEHYLSDPSTGTPTATATANVSRGTLPAAAAPAVSTVAPGAAG